VKYGIGDEVRVVHKNKTDTGILIKDSPLLILKLSSGYNIGIDKKNIKKIERVKKAREIKETPISVKQNKKLPMVSILHTGGTVASKVDYRTGGVVSRFEAEELIGLFPELGGIAQISSQMLGNMWSDDIRFSHFNRIGKAVKKEVDSGASGIIVSMGTDNLHYAAAALSFILDPCPVPVLFVGAQRSSDRGSSDAAYNLLSAATFIAKSDFAGVGLCMHENMSDDYCWILPGCKVRKMHSSRRDAFRPIGTSSIARVGWKEKKIEFMKKEYSKRSSEKIGLHLFAENLKVGLVKVHPQFFSAELVAYTGFDGLLLEGTGLGHIPLDVVDESTKEHEKVKKVLAGLCKKMPVVMSSQTIYGRIQMNVYSKGRDLQELGVRGNLCNMTPETAFVKLAWLLSQKKKKEDVLTLYEENLRGEISERTEQDWFLE